MNTNKVIALVAGLTTSASVSIAVNAAVDILTPPAVGPIAGFALKVGGKVVGGIAGLKIGDIVEGLVMSALEETPVAVTEDTPTQND